ncbi:hypothetical protein MICCA_1060079 [Microcystis aeruginosa PCC 9432]|jgi:hypothetical protein|uniref:Uncharacterized protein n=5 Tax=Microcystis aeruginosa TaxID=1126 RepID=S3JI08_MICAE|nr:MULTISPECIES: hypothetical protein [Microcystis]EPF24675.1 hypothetical protein MAESPC_00348 [Microcystis aeruginosa SPC777]ARI79627.1 hypothetical protein BH695_0346 [Microcystis aeruginosa PCC 7806SL]ELP55370.1 hypothetical protein O53_4201 [Microcystis aeruginosa TAIHU98]ELS47174.1 hypothetical protein C789_3008 [Microcystis aeruginosa FACHB-905 = DIANCHI905]MCZ8242423.1 hypothetical protein [Microcystis sp. LE19-131.1A]
MQRVKVSFIVIEPEFEIANLIDPVVQKTPERLAGQGVRVR